MRKVGGEQRVFSEVRVPSEADEDHRWLARERDRLVREHTGHINRIRSLLALYGLRGKSLRGLETRLGELRCWDGGLLPADLTAELTRELAQLRLVEAQTRELEALQR